MIRLYTIFPDVETPRHEVPDLLKPFVKKQPLDPKDRNRIYGSWTQSISWTENIETADLAVLPYSWNHYFERKCLPKALDFIDRCRAQHKQVITQITGDFGYTPPVRDVIVLRQSGHASTKLPFQLTLPVFIPDPYLAFQEFLTPGFDSKPDKPLIGFCGQAGGGIMKYAVDASHTFVRNAAYYVGWNKLEPQELTPSSFLREKILQILEHNPELETAFIRRRQYRAGARTEAQRQISSQEFFRNIVSTAYTVCVRGSGNFSVRLYETLAMGRIPLWVNTDSILPFPDHLPWDQHIVKVEMSELHQMPQLLLNYHQNIPKEQWHERMQGHREFWLKYLSSEGFWPYFFEVVLPR